MNWNNIDLNNPYERQQNFLDGYDCETLLLEVACNLKVINRDTVELAELKREDTSFNLLSEDKKLAEQLHKKLCKWNHTDGCGWFYESWDKPGYSREEWLKKAKEILKITDSETAIKIAGLL